MASKMMARKQTWAREETAARRAVAVALQRKGRAATGDERRRLLALAALMERFAALPAAAVADGRSSANRMRWRRVSAAYRRQLEVVATLLSVAPRYPHHEAGSRLGREQEETLIERAEMEAI